MEIAALRDFLLVVDSGSLTRAAVLAGVSQPAMSQRIAQLEQKAGVRLLERGPRGVEATAAGLELYRGAQQVVRQVDRLVDSLGTGGREIRGSVSVGLPATVAPMLVPELVPLVRKRNPGIRLELFESMSGYIQELLGRGRLDLAVLFRGPGDIRPGEVHLYREALFFATKLGEHPDPTPVTATDLTGHELVAPGSRSNLRNLIDRFFASAGQVAPVIADVESLPAMVRLVQGGGVSSIFPRSVTATTSGPLLNLRPLQPAVHRSVAVCTAPEFYEPRIAVLAVRDAISDAVRRVAERGEWPGIELQTQSERNHS